MPDSQDRRRDLNGGDPSAGMALRAYEPQVELPPHRHEEIQVTMILGGSLTEWCGEERFESRPLDVVIKPAGVEHTNRFGPRGARTLQFVLPSDRSRELVRSGLPLNRVLWWSDETLTRMFLRRARQSQAPLASISRRTTNTGRHAPRPCSSGQPRRDTNIGPAYLVDIWRRLDERFSQNTETRVRRLAQDAGVHPVHLARVFRSKYGMSITARLRQLRIQAAADWLCRNDLPLTGVAGQCGFADQSHLCRVFKSYTGMTPLGFRRLATGVR